VVGNVVECDYYFVFCFLMDNVPYGDSSFGAKMTFEQEQNQKAVKNPSNLTRRLKQVASKVTSGLMPVGKYWHAKATR
jgi:hypothetical protein